METKPDENTDSESTKPDDDVTPPASRQAEFERVLKEIDEKYSSTMKKLAD